MHHRDVEGVLLMWLCFSQQDLNVVSERHWEGVPLSSFLCDGKLAAKTLGTLAQWLKLGQSMLHQQTHTWQGFHVACATQSNRAQTHCMNHLIEMHIQPKQTPVLSPNSTFLYWEKWIWSYESHCFLCTFGQGKVPVSFSLIIFGLYSLFLVYTLRPKRQRETILSPWHHEKCRRWMSCYF